MQYPLKSLISALIVIVSVFLIFAADADAKCPGGFFNPVTDVCWHCIFPIKIAGIKIASSDLEDAPDPARSPLCVCPPLRLGIPVSFWEPARFIETVNEPFCFPSIGTKISGMQEGFLGGSNTALKRGEGIEYTFQQAHYFIAPLWGMLDLFLDFPCLENTGFDIAYITEIDPTWNNDNLAFILNPEALLFANPAAQLSCVADSVAANTGLPLNPLFWCMGSWGSAYPLTGRIAEEDYVQANAAIAARMIYKLARILAICDTGVDLCGCVRKPIWVKQNYRLHTAKPVKDSTCRPIGRSGLTWTSGKNPPYKGDNFVWMVFRKRVCCVSISPF